MDGLTFTSNLFRDLAWPGVTIFVIWLVLNRLPKIARFVKAIRYKDFEITMREEFEEAREKAEEVKVEGGEIVDPQSVVEENLARVIDIDPALAIPGMWSKIEGELLSLMSVTGGTRYGTPLKFAHHLWKRGMLTDSEYNLLESLRIIRNQAVHARAFKGPTKAEVVEYAAFVSLITKKLENIKNSGYSVPPKNS